MKRSVKSEIVPIAIVFLFLILFREFSVNALEYPGQYPMALWTEGYKEEIVKNDENQKVIFLTFDDGPSKNNTPKILDILNEKNVRATFFVIGYKAEVNKDIVRSLKESGMSILPHSYTHDYKSIYASPDNFLNDLNKCTKAIEDATGDELISFLRFPGGSDNLVCNANTLNEIKEKVKNQGVSYIDWNICSEDATANIVSKSKILDSVRNEARGIRYGVLLMHDAEAKVTTVEALPEIIDEFKSRGYIFKTFDEITEYDMEKLKMNGVINR